MKTLIALSVFLLAGSMAQAQGTLSFSHVKAYTGQDTLYWGDTSLHLEADWALGNAYIMTGEKVAVKVYAKIDNGPTGGGAARVLSMDITLKSNHEKENKHVEVDLSPDGTLATTVTEQFNFSGGNGTPPVTLSFNIILE